MRAFDSDRAGAPRRLAVTLLLFALALLVRTLHVLELADTAWADERSLVSDSAYYDQRAREIADGDLVGSGPGFLSPLYCYFLGAVYAVSGKSLLAAKLAQACLGALAVALVHRAGRLVFGEAAAALAGLALALYGVLVYYSGLLLPDGLVLFWHALFLWLCVRRAPFGWTALFAGLVVGMAVGTKANAILLVPATSAWILAGFRERPLTSRLLAVALLVAATFLAIAPITLRNWLATERFVLVTATGGRNLLKGNGPEATGTHAQLTIETVNLTNYLERDVDVDRALREDRELGALAVQAMVEDPARAAGLFLKKLLLFFNVRELGIRDNYAFARTQSALLGLPLVSFALLAPLGLAGFFLFGFGERRAVLVSLLLGTQVVSFVLVFVLARYRLAAIALLALFAGALLARTASDLRARRWRRPLFAFLLTAAGCALVRLPIEGFEAPETTSEQHAFVGDWHYGRSEPALALREYEAALEQVPRSKFDELVLRSASADCLEALGEAQRAALVRAEVLEEVRAINEKRVPALLEQLEAEVRRRTTPRDER